MWRMRCARSNATRNLAFVMVFGWEHFYKNDGLLGRITCNCCAMLVGWDERAAWWNVSLVTIQPTPFTKPSVNISIRIPLVSYSTHHRICLHIFQSATQRSRHSSARRRMQWIKYLTDNRIVDFVNRAGSFFLYSFSNRAVCWDKRFGSS